MKKAKFYVTEAKFPEKGDGGENPSFKFPRDGVLNNLACFPVQTLRHPF